MGIHAVEKGPVAKRVTGNAKRLRERRGLTLNQLSARMTEIGRPTLASGLSKIEQGDRRVDVDDLVALAVAFEVNPNVLLMPAEADETEEYVTEDVKESTGRMWSWVAGDEPLLRWTAEGRKVGFGDPTGGRYDLSLMAEWFELAKPHKSGDAIAAETIALAQLMLTRISEDKEELGELQAALDQRRDERPARDGKR